MKSSRILRRLLAVCTVSLLAMASAYAFEGKIDMTMTMGKDVIPVTYYIKGSRMRVESTRAVDKKGNKMTMTMLTDQDARQMLLLMDQQKMYMSFGIPQQDTEKSAKTFDFKPTGRKEKIAGYDAEEYAGTSEGKRMETWLTKGLGQFSMPNMGHSGRRAAQPTQLELFLRDGNYFPLRMIVRKAEGAPEEMHTEATKIEKASEPDSLFVPPADYKKFEMPDVGSALKGLIPGGR